jgi:hypothetical protein
VQWETKDDPAGDYWPLVQHLLTSPPRKLNCLQLLERWPKGAGRPNPAILEACLARAVSDGRVKQEGTGQRSDRVRYFIDGLDATWMPDITELLGY